MRNKLRKKHLLKVFVLFPLFCFSQNDLPQHIKDGNYDVNAVRNPTEAGDKLILQSLQDVHNNGTHTPSLDGSVNRTNSHRTVNGKTKEKNTNQQNTKDKGGTEEVALKIIQEMSNPETVEDPYKYAKTYSFDPGPDETGFSYDRFAKSPCFSKLGFSAYRNRADQDKAYCECERKYWREKAGVGFIVILLLGGVAYMIWLSRGGGKISFRNPFNRADNKAI